MINSMRGLRRHILLAKEILFQKLPRIDLKVQQISPLRRKEKLFRLLHPLQARFRLSADRDEQMEKYDLG